MTPWESTTNVVVATNNDINPVPCPGRCTIDRIAVVRVGTGAIAADFYNRAFTGPATAVYAVTDDGTGKCRLLFRTSYPVKVGDVVTVSASAKSAYNTSHRVTKVGYDDKTVDTDQAFVDDADGRGPATATLAIPTTEQSLYKVTPQLTGTDAGEASPGVVFVNQDPQTNLTNRGYPQRLYVKFAAAGTYRVSIRVRQSVAMGD